MHENRTSIAEHEAYQHYLRHFFLLPSTFARFDMLLRGVCMFCIVFVFCNKRLHVLQYTKFRYGFIICFWARYTAVPSSVQLPQLQCMWP